MTHTPHELAEEFPDKVQLIRELKSVDRHFAKLADDYHELNRRIHRAETCIEPLEALTEVELRKERIRLKDTIAAILG